MCFRSFFVLLLARCSFSQVNYAINGSWIPLAASPRQSRQTNKPPGKFNPGKVLSRVGNWTSKNLTPAEDRVYTPPAPGYGAPPPPHADNCYLETPCTRSCGDGFKLLLPNPDGEACYGAALQVFPCNLVHCPVDCVWGPWAHWSPCGVEPHHPHTVKRQRRTADGDGEHGHHPPFAAPLTGYGGAHHPPLAPSSGPFCGQGRSRAIDRPAGYGGILCIGEPVEQRFCQSLQCLGPQGPIGHLGDPGIPGTNGYPGQDGRPGDRGPNGVDGRQGPPGTPGRDGGDGRPGPQGLPGHEGKIGEKGPPGAIGPPGPQGISGAPGPRGQTGEKGDDGPPGPVGQQGPAGSDGHPGVGGPAGPPGLNGAPGVLGPMGFVGLPGEQGLTGAPGPRGLQGPKGIPYHPHHPPPVVAPLPTYHNHHPPPFSNKKREAPYNQPITLQQSQFSTKNVHVNKENKGYYKSSGNKGNYKSSENKGYYKSSENKEKWLKSSENQKKWLKKDNTDHNKQQGNGWERRTQNQKDSREQNWEPRHTKSFNKGSNFGPSHTSSTFFKSGSSFSNIVRGPDAVDIGNQDFTGSDNPNTIILPFEITTTLTPQNQNKSKSGNKNNKNGDKKSSRRVHN